MRINPQTETSKVAGGPKMGSAAIDAALSKGFDAIANGGSVKDASAAVLGQVISDPKTRKAVEPHLEKLFGNAESFLQGSKTGEAGLKALRELASRPEVRSRIGQALQTALGDQLGGKLGGHIGAVLAAFTKGGLGAAVTSAAAHTKPVKDLIEGAGGATKLVESSASNVPVMGLLDSVVKHGTTALDTNAPSWWVSVATIAANVIATVVPSLGPTALKAAGALNTRAAKSEFSSQNGATGTAPPPSPGETPVPQASQTDLFGGAVTEKAKPVPGSVTTPLPKGADRLVRDVMEQLRQQAGKGSALVGPDAQAYATRIVLHGVDVAYSGNMSVDLTVKEFRNRVMDIVRDAVLPEVLAWAGKPLRYKPVVTEPGALSVSREALTQWYVAQGIPAEVVDLALSRQNILKNGEVATILLNAYEGNMMQIFEKWGQGDTLPAPGPLPPDPLPAGLTVPIDTDSPGDTDGSAPVQTAPPATPDVVDQQYRQRLERRRLEQFRRDITGERSDVDASFTGSPDDQRQVQQNQENQQAEARRQQQEFDRQQQQRQIDERNLEIQRQIQEQANRRY